MAEYIDRFALIDAMQAYQYDAGKDGFAIMALIGIQPTADVAPIVRCKDCKHYRVYMEHDMCARNVKLLGGREVGLCATGKDDFCNYGERKKR